MFGLGILIIQSEKPLISGVCAWVGGGCSCDTEIIDPAMLVKAIEPIPAVQPAASQCGNRQHGSQGIGHDVDVGRFQVEIVICRMIMGVSMSMSMLMLMAVAGMVQNCRADKVDRKTQHGNSHGLRVADGLRREQSFPCTKQHQGRDGEQEKAKQQRVGTALLG